jgi:hypothetical protein
VQARDVRQRHDGVLVNGHPAVIGKSGLIDRQVVHVDGDFVVVREAWDGAAPDFPMCMLPRGTVVREHVVQRHVPMFRSEAIKLGLIR